MEGLNAACNNFQRRQWHPTPVLLLGKSHRWRSLQGYSPWGRWGSDRTERLHFHFSLSCIGEGNGNPLQCSCLENPRDGASWWAAVYGVAESRTRLKWLSSNNFCKKVIIFFFFFFKVVTHKLLVYHLVFLTAPLKSKKWLSSLVHWDSNSLSNMLTSYSY